MGGAEGGGGADGSGMSGSTSFSGCEPEASPGEETMRSGELSSMLWKASGNMVLRFTS